jgi:hypothetical protein
MAYTRVSPGIWRDANGATIRSATDPNKGATNRPGSSPKGKPTISAAGPMGNSSATVDKNGNVVTNQTLSQGQQGALSGLEGASAGASGTLQGVVNSPGFFQNWAQNPGSTQGYEDAFFNHLTGAGKSTGLDATYGRDKDQLAQTLANRGIPVGSQLYNNQMAQLSDRYDTQKADYKDQAVTGGVNAFNQGQQNMFQGVNSLSGVGQAGFFNPQGPDASGIYGQNQGYRLGQQQIQGQQNIAGMNNATSAANARLRARGGAAPLPQSPFS